MSNQNLTATNRKYMTAKHAKQREREPIKTCSESIFAIFRVFRGQKQPQLSC
jgi:hypothetical protein